MTKLQKFILRKMTRTIVIQGGHEQRIIAYYRILAEAARAEFTEDNKITLDTFLEDCHKESLKESNKCKCCGREFQKEK